MSLSDQLIIVTTKTACRFDSTKPDQIGLPKMLVCQVFSYSSIFHHANDCPDLQGFLIQSKPIPP